MTIERAKKFFADWKKDPDNAGETWGTANVLAEFAALETAPYREALQALVEATHNVLYDEGVGPIADRMDAVDAALAAAKELLADTGEEAGR